MRAAVYHADHDVRLEEVPAPVRAPGEALLEVLRSGMCGTDATEWKAGPLTFPVQHRHPVTGQTGPMIPGHEFVGKVLEVDESSHFSVGDIVASGAGVSCGVCDRCAEGRTNLCDRYYTLGLNTDGGMAEFVSCPESTLVLVPEGLPIDLAGLAQPLAVGLHAARRSGVRDGDRVVLIGAGAIGSFVLAGLKSLVSADVTVIDFPGARLERARRLGATRVVEAGADAAARVAEAIGPFGADVVVEASGAPGQLNNALAMVRKGGTILQVGLPSAEQLVDIHSLVMREITVRTTLAHVCGTDLAPALGILATTNLGTELLDSVRPLDDLAEQLERLATGRLEGKVLFDPRQGAA
ncbi:MULTISPECIES: zinc-dependent alcohol dehydrogenase [unclassified Cryobacterium]|uniref:zinc-dependent alcohol dehydrogenase n=1 Tax=unclassified Cryobacterium TaxID=2649013 RepID=UPI002AB49561|nr:MULTISPECIES: alcohol dehydrogenase catalytic domain-containing protein [unclassified Cryobacterium]MDY7529463.1 alcohol dehydrogenase catalytic domain-containing protein [Cryobacterium sp. 10C2]MDY7558391.1 alcohol dehydrogenase catalytic domain-containing protein [Cryobacterium sp. 10C3]MEB0201629.1 alcohol dehydrogenase catalytic domain-containing protein [Cryobacterium sp. 5I3]MEB0290761.1 alcohol dehydrogenase catalytic domain-containing protein [Cryobacterium sp. 10C2]